MPQDSKTYYELTEMVWMNPPPSVLIQDKHCLENNDLQTFYPTLPILHACQQFLTHSAKATAVMNDYMWNTAYLPAHASPDLQPQAVPLESFLQYLFSYILHLPYLLRTLHVP